MSNHIHDYFIPLFTYKLLIIPKCSLEFVDLAPQLNKFAAHAKVGPICIVLVLFKKQFKHPRQYTKENMLSLLCRRVKHFDGYSIAIHYRTHTQFA